MRPWRTRQPRSATRSQASVVHGECRQPFVMATHRPVVSAQTRSEGAERQPACPLTKRDAARFRQTRPQFD